MRHLLAVVMLLAALPATGEHEARVRGFVSGRLLAAWCERDGPRDVEACLTYLRAVYDTVAALDFDHRLLAERAEDVFGCIPPMVPVTELVIVYRRHASQYPDGLERQAASVVLEALRANYACE
ncbi:MAG: hypothetical protein H6983_04630 [Ectothiorhodospiraceae bacterium]|nr:hypothetical protein [Ectothiorhodospiraceae bacterium]